MLYATTCSLNKCNNIIIIIRWCHISSGTCYIIYGITLKTEERLEDNNSRKSNSYQIEYEK